MKRTRGEILFGYFNVCIMVAICVVTLYPLWHIAMASISDPLIVYAKRGFYFWPVGALNFKGYKLVLENPLIASGFMNTGFYLSIGTVLSMLFTIMGAYGLSRKGAYWNKYILKMVVFTMYFQGGLIPFYILVKGMGLINSRWSIILPIIVNTWNFIILRTAFSSVPESLIESAKIDGAADWTIIWRIVVPVMSATVAVITLFYAVRYWNEWFNPSLFLNDKTKYPIQLVLREILLKNNTSDMANLGSVGQTGQESYRLLVKYCTIIVATVPILIVYPFLQKYFIAGVMVGSIKE